MASVKRDSNLYNEMEKLENKRRQMNNFGFVRKSVVLIITFSFIFLFQPAVYSNSESPPSTINLDVWEAYVETASVEQDNNYRFYKYMSPQKVVFLGEPTKEDITTIDQTVKKVNEYCPSSRLEISNNWVGDAIKIYFIDESEFEQYIPEIESGNSSYLQWWYYPNGFLAKTIILVDNQLSQSARNKIIKSRIIQSLGFLGSDTYASGYNVLSGNFDSDSSIEFSDLDRQLFGLHCNPDLTSGMEIDEYARVLSSYEFTFANRIISSSFQIDLSELSNNKIIKWRSNINSQLEARIQGVNWVLYLNKREIASGFIDSAEDMTRNPWVINLSRFLKNSGNYTVSVNALNNVNQGNPQEFTFKFLANSKSGEFECIDSKNRLKKSKDGKCPKGTRKVEKSSAN